MSSIELGMGRLAAAAAQAEHRSEAIWRTVPGDGPPTLRPPVR